MPKVKLKRTERSASGVASKKAGNRPSTAKRHGVKSHPSVVAAIRADETYPVDEFLAMLGYTGPHAGAGRTWLSHVRRDGLTILKDAGGKLFITGANWMAYQQTLSEYDPAPRGKDAAKNKALASTKIADSDSGIREKESGGDSQN